MNRQAVVSAAARLRGAAASKTPIAPLTSDLSALDVESAYQVQRCNLEQELKRGGRVAGHKVGLTSKAMQDMLGVASPDYGYLLEDMFIENGGSVSIDRFLQPKVEIEIAFRMRSAVGGSEIDIADVIAATEAVAPAIEIIDSRIKDWRIQLPDTIADNASSAAVVIGPWRDLPPIDLAEIRGDLVVNGVIREVGHGRDVLGHPAASVAWLAETLNAYRVEIARGHVVMPGSCTRAMTVSAGDVIVGEFEELGSASVTFVAPNGSGNEKGKA